MYIHPSRSAAAAAPAPTAMPSPNDWCPRCRNAGIRISPTGIFETCPDLVLGNVHPPISDEAKMIREAVTQSGLIDSHLFEIARSMIGFSTSYPISRFELIERHFRYLHGDEVKRRALSRAIERMRDEMLLPVGSRKGAPSGYWIIIELPDFERWYTEKRSQPLKELTTIHKLARHYWPVFAEQIRLDFTQCDSDID